MQNPAPWAQPRARRCAGITAALVMIGATLPMRAAGAAVQVRAAGDVCCPYTIASVDARAGVVTAQETASGKTFTFKVNDAALLSSLAAGEGFDTDPAVSTLRHGEAFSMIRTSTASRPLGRPGRAIARPAVSRIEVCCSIVSPLTGGNAPAPAGAQARPAGEAAGAVISRGAAAPTGGAPAAGSPGANLPTVGLPTVQPPTIEAVNYAIDLVELHCRKIWYGAIGDRDRVLLELWAYDAGSEQKGLYVAHTFTCRNDTKQYLNLEPIFAAAALHGNIMVSGNFMVTHPQNGQNIVDALRDLAELEVDVVQGISTSGLVELPDGVAKLVATFTGEGVRDKIVEFRGNFLVELFNAIGRAVCGGGNPRTWNKSIGLNPLGTSFFDEWGGEVYKLWYISEGAKPETCFREIKYDLFARIRAN